MENFFDATKIAPQQGVGGHPPGRFPVAISNTYGEPTKDQSGLMFCVEFTSQVGRIVNRYNIYNSSPKAVEIAQKELSALCHATKQYQLTWPKDAGGNPDLPNFGRELRGKQLQIDVAPQLNKDGTPNGYMEVSKVYDLAGNEPGRTSQPPQPEQQGQAPMQQQPNGGWGSAPTQQQPAWGNQPQQQPQPQPQTQPQWGAPQPQQPTNQPNTPNKPPWA